MMDQKDTILATPSRKITIGGMQKDYEFRCAQKMTLALFDAGLLSKDEFEQISSLNTKTFTPFLAELYQ